MQEQPRSVPAWALWVLALGWIVPGLLGREPWKADEAVTLGPILHLLQGGGWVVPLLGGEPWLERPPLYYWVAALFAKLLAPPLAIHDAARLATGFFAALTLLWAGLAGRELFGQRRGWTSVLVLLGCIGLMLRMHQLVSEAATLAGAALALYGLALSLRRPILAGLLFGTGLGMAFLSRGLGAPVILALTALALPLSPPWRRKELAVCVAVGIGAAAPWLAVWPWLLHGASPALFDQWLAQGLARMSGWGGGGRPLYYLGILPWFAWPALPLALWALWEGRNRLAGSSGLTFATTAFLVGVAVLSAGRDARELYALPLLLPLAWLGAEGLFSLRRGAASAMYWFAAMGFTVFIAAGWFYWAGLELGLPARLQAHLLRLHPGYEPGVRWLPVAVAVAATAGWGLLLATARRGPDRPALAWGAGITAVWAVIVTLLIGWADTGKGYRQVMTSLGKALPAKYDCIESRRLGDGPRAQLHYYAGVVTVRPGSPAARKGCDLLLAQGTLRSAPLPEGRWEKIWEGGRPREKEERFRLYRRE